VIPRPELLQSGVLRCVATEGSGVDHEDRLADMFSELDVRTLESRKRKGVGGDAGHGGRLREGRGRECASEQGEDASAISKHGLSRRRTALSARGNWLPRC